MAQISALLAKPRKIVLATWAIRLENRLLRVGNFVYHTHLDCGQLETTNRIESCQ